MKTKITFFKQFGLMLSKIVLFVHYYFGSPTYADWGFSSPTLAANDTAGNVSLLSLWLGGDVMFKAQAQKHRAVSNVTDENTQSPVGSCLLVIFIMGGFMLEKLKFYGASIALMLILNLVLILCMVVLFPTASTSVGETLGRDVLITALYGVHIVLGGCFAFFTAIGGATMPQEPSVLLIMINGLIYSVIYYAVFKLMTCHIGQLNEFIKIKNANPYVIFATDVLVVAIVFSTLITLNSFLQPVITYYFVNAEIILNKSMPLILWNIFVVQLLGGVIMRSSILIFQKTKGKNFNQIFSKVDKNRDG